METNMSTRKLLALHFSQILFRFASRNDRSNYLATETVTWISDVPVIRTIVPVT